MFDGRFAAWMPQFIEPHDSLFRLIAMVACYDLLVVAWLCTYGVAISRARRSGFGVRVRATLERVTGVVMIGLGMRLAQETR